jgi:hypothetical protein
MKRLPGSRRGPHSPPTPLRPTEPPAPLPEERFVRFDFPPGATAEVIAEGIRKLVEQHSRRRTS